jgi:hypothetical protein
MPYPFPSASNPALQKALNIALDYLEILFIMPIRRDVHRAAGPAHPADKAPAAARPRLICGAERRA